MPRRTGETLQIGECPINSGDGLKVQYTGAEGTSLLSSDATYTASHATSLHGEGPRDMQGTNGYQNGFGGSGIQQNLMSGTSLSACEGGPAQERCHHESQRFLHRASGTSQESTDSQSGSDEAPKQRLGGLWPRRAKKKLKGKEKVEKEGGSDKASKRHKGWQILGSRTAERSGPSSSSPSASSPSKLSDSSDALVGADAADAGTKGEQMLSPSSAAISAAQAEPLLEMVSSPPVASSGCLGMFMRGKSDEVTVRATSQQSLTTEGRKAKKVVEKVPQRASQRSSEAAPRAISNGSHGSTSSAVSSRRSSFEEVRAPATEGDMQAPQSSSQWYLKFSAFAAAASKHPTAHETESPRAGQGAEMDLNDSCAEEGGRVSQSSDGGPAKDSEQAEKKGHRRNQSLGSYFTSFVTKRTASVPINLDKAVEAKRDADKDPPSPKTPRTQNGDEEGPGVSAEAPAVPKTPELSRNQSALACFGFSGKVATGEDGDEEVENSKGSKGNETDAMPSGSVGLKNLGNTCFINSALQVLRWTPGFAELLVPDLLSMDPLPAPSIPGAGNACANTTPAPPLPTAPTELGPLSSSVAALSALAVAPESLGGPQTADSSQSSPRAYEEPSVSRVLRSDAVATAEAVNGCGASLQLPTIRENSPSIPEPEPLAPVRTRSVVEVRICSQAAELGADSMQQVDALCSAIPAAKSAALSEEEPGTAAMEQVETAGHAMQQGSPLGPETPAICEVPFPVPSLAGSPESLWGQTPAHSNASTGSAQAVEEQQTDPSSTGSNVTVVEGLQSGAGVAGVAEPVMHQVVCACGMHTVGVPAEGLTVNIAAATVSRDPAQKLPPLERGEMAAAFCQLTKQVFRESPGGWVDPTPLVKKLYQLPQGAEFQDGGQHDCQEALRSILMGLHDDLNRAGKPGQQQRKLQTMPDETGPNMPAEETGMGKEASKQEVTEGKGQSDSKGPDALSEAELEAAKADREWARHLAQDNSVIYDLFSGQLQSTIKCHKCNKRFTTYEVFLDLSLPLTKEGKGGVLSFLSKNSTPSIEDCLQAFTTDEVMQGDEAFQCEHCNERTTATKHFRIHRLPKVLVLHIKRFKYTGTTREKITTNVTFPLKNLSLQQFMSEESGQKETTTSSYDLFAVSNHQGSIAAGHYMAVCKAPSPPGSKEKEQWYCFNDVSVKKLAASAVPSSNAYLLCYYRKDAEAK